MARPKVDPTAPSAPKTPEEAIEQGVLDVSDIPANREDNDTLQQTIAKTSVALDAKRAALDKIGTGRDLSYSLIEMEMGSRAQVAWVRFYIPRKKKGEAVEDGDDE